MCAWIAGACGAGIAGVPVPVRGVPLQRVPRGGAQLDPAHLTLPQHHLTPRAHRHQTTSPRKGV